MAAVLLAAAPAAADPDAYPQIAADRPLLYAPGMTVADLALDAPTYRYGYSSHTAVGDYVYPGLSVAHAFDDFELSASFSQAIVGPYVNAGGGAYLGPGVLWLNASALIPNNDSGLDRELWQNVDYHAKAVVVPHALSLNAGAALNMYEVTRSDGLSIDPVNLGVSAGAVLQLVPELSVAPFVAVYIPVADTQYSHTSCAAGVTLRYVINKVDVYAWARGDDLQRAPLPGIGGGVLLHFGG